MHRPTSAIGGNQLSTLPNNTRRQLLGSLLAAPLLWPALARAQQTLPASRAIPSTGEILPLVGLGSWITFNVGDDRAARDASAEVMRAFFQAGGRLIDSSPMYGSAQEVIGYGLKKLGAPKICLQQIKYGFQTVMKGACKLRTRVDCGVCRAWI